MPAPKRKKIGDKNDEQKAKAIKIRKKVKEIAEIETVAAKIDSSELDDSVLKKTICMRRVKDGWVVEMYEIVGDTAKRVSSTEPDVRQYAFDNFRQLAVQNYFGDE